MHELAICQSMIDQLEGIANERGAKKVYSILVGIGALSGVEGQLLQNAFSISANGTVAENAELLLQHIPVRVRCDQCGTESDVIANKLICQKCGNWRTTLISGDELLLLSVELEKNVDQLSE